MEEPGLEPFCEEACACDLRGPVSEVRVVGDVWWLTRKPPLKRTMRGYFPGGKDLGIRMSVVMEWELIFLYVVVVMLKPENSDRLPLWRVSEARMVRRRR